MTSELRKKPECDYFRLLPVLICPHMALKIAVFGIANLAYAAEINFTTCDLCLRNPNAIALPYRHNAFKIELAKRTIVRAFTLAAEGAAA